jgi:hypothetical protein
VFAWQWRATFADGEDVPVGRPLPADATVADLPITSAGTYTVEATLTGTPACTGSTTIAVQQPAGQLATFRLRVTPPAAAGLPAQDLDRQITGGTPSGGNVLALSDGIRVPLDVRGAADGQPLGAYVRLTDDATGAVVEGRTAASGGTAAMRVPAGRYDVLVVPDGDLAPALMPSQSAALLAEAPVLMDEGTPVTGTVVDATGAGLPGASVVLRAGALPSTRATSDATGAFALRARAGTFGVAVALPVGGGTLEVDLPESAGVTVAPGAATDLHIQMAALPAAQANVQLTARDAASLGPGTRVVLDTAAPLAAAGWLSSAPGGAPQAMAGQVRVTTAPDAAGLVVVDGLPRATYRMTTYPADAGTSDALTVAAVDLGAGPTSIALASKVMVRGRLLPEAAAAGARVLAVDDDGLPAAVAADAGAGGLYALPVSPERRYTLRALPRPEQALARAIFPPVEVADTDLDLDARSMPPGLLYAGKLVDPSIVGVGGALVQAFCAAVPSSLAGACADPTTPVAEAVTTSDGSFVLMLPDPGVAP